MRSYLFVQFFFDLDTILDVKMTILSLRHDDPPFCTRRREEEDIGLKSKDEILDRPNATSVAAALTIKANDAN